MACNTIYEKDRISLRIYVIIQISLLCLTFIRNRTHTCTYKLQSLQIHITNIFKEKWFIGKYISVYPMCVWHTLRRRNDPMLHQNYVTLSFTNTSAYIYLYGIHCRTATLPHFTLLFLVHVCTCISCTE